MDVKHILVEKINEYIELYKFVHHELSEFTIEQWIFLVCFVLFFSIIIANSENSTARLLVYGKNLNNKDDENRYDNAFPGFITRASRKLETLTVPKSYFVHYYVFFSILCLIQFLVAWNFNTEAIPALNDVVVYISTWYQTYEALRRLYEDLFVSKFSNNRMNVIHYLFGLGYYAMVSAVSFGSMLPYYISQTTFPTDLDLNDILFIGVFIFYSVDQFQNHHHLSQLVKYTIPTFRFFEYCASPHYLDEIIIYTVVLRNYLMCEGIAWIKADFIIIWLLVILNLSVSAKETYRYYGQKFKEFKTPYKLIPFVW